LKEETHLIPVLPRIHEHINEKVQGHSLVNMPLLKALLRLAVAPPVSTWGEFKGFFLHVLLIGFDCLLSLSIDKNSNDVAILLQHIPHARRAVLEIGVKSNTEKVL
jgi:hypothetical protein